MPREHEHDLIYSHHYLRALFEPIFLQDFLMMMAFFPKNIHWSSLFPPKTRVNTDRVPPGHPITLLKSDKSIWPSYRLKGLLRRVYFPWERINWIKEEQSSDGKDFIIPRDLLKPVSIKLRVTGTGINLGTVSFLPECKEKTGILCLNMIYPGWKIPITSTNLCMNLRQ